MTGQGCLRIFDMNLRQMYFDEAVLRVSLELADVLKLNEYELRIVADVFSLGSEEVPVVDRLMEENSLTLLALTRAERGSLLCTREQKVEHPGYPREEVVDTVGAGDAYAAILAIGYLRKWNPDRILSVANRFAGKLCTVQGAIPTTRFYREFQDIMEGHR